MKEPAQWIEELAAEVDRLIQRYEAMPRFQEMIDLRATAYLAKFREQRRFDGRRRKHFEKTRGDRRLSDYEAGPPKKGWVWDVCRVRIAVSKQPPRSEYERIEAWVPLRFSNRVRPELESLLPLRREQELDLADKYTCLAAVHDLAVAGGEKILSYVGSELGEGRLRPKVIHENMLKRANFESEIKAAGRLPSLEKERLFDIPNHRVRLKRYCARVKTDIIKWHKKYKPAKRLKAKLPKMSRKQRRIADEALLRTAILEHHGFDDSKKPEDLSFEPPTQKDLGKLLGWSRYKVLRTSKRIFPRGGWSAYLRTCTNPKPLHGFLKRVEDKATNPEAVIYPRTIEPTEKEQTKADRYNT